MSVKVLVVQTTTSLVIVKIVNCLLLSGEVRGHSWVFPLQTLFLLHSQASSGLNPEVRLGFLDIRESDMHGVIVHKQRCKDVHDFLKLSYIGAEFAFINSIFSPTFWNTG